jgi:hypothetical protein
MFQVLHIRNTLIHVPSIACVTLYKSLMGKPVLEITTHIGSINTIKYGYTMWDNAVCDYQVIQKSLVGCQEALKSVPWMEPVKKPELS